MQLEPAATGACRPCRVEGCTADLSNEKDYCRKHRVCPKHLKDLSVLVAGQASRWCQQCARFHPLSSFNGSRRSCRERLALHGSRSHGRKLLHASNGSHAAEDGPQPSSSGSSNMMGGSPVVDINTGGSSSSKVRHTADAASPHSSRHFLSSSAVHRAAEHGATQGMAAAAGGGMVGRPTGWSMLGQQSATVPCTSQPQLMSDMMRDMLGSGWVTPGLRPQSSGHSASQGIITKPLGWSAGGMDVNNLGCRSKQHMTAVSHTQDMAIGSDSVPATKRRAVTYDDIQVLPDALLACMDYNSSPAAIMDTCSEPLPHGQTLSTPPSIPRGGTTPLPHVRPQDMVPKQPTLLDAVFDNLIIAAELQPGSSTAQQGLPGGPCPIPVPASAPVPGLLDSFTGTPPSQAATAPQLLQYGGGGASACESPQSLPCWPTEVHTDTLPKGTSRKLDMELQQLLADMPMERAQETGRLTPLNLDLESVPFFPVSSPVRRGASGRNRQSRLSSSATSTAPVPNPSHPQLPVYQTPPSLPGSSYIPALPMQVPVQMPITDQAMPMTTQAMQPSMMETAFTPVTAHSTNAMQPLYTACGPVHTPHASGFALRGNTMNLEECLQQQQQLLRQEQARLQQQQLQLQTQQRLLQQAQQQLQQLQLLQQEQAHLQQQQLQRQTQQQLLQQAQQQLQQQQLLQAQLKQFQEQQSYMDPNQLKLHKKL